MEERAVTNEDLASHLQRVEAKLDALAKAQGLKIRPTPTENKGATKFDAAKAPSANAVRGGEAM